MAKQNDPGSPPGRKPADELPAPHSRNVVLSSAATDAKLSHTELGSYIATALGLWLVLELHLLGGLLAGLLVYQLIYVLTPLIEKHVPGQLARWLAVVVLSAIIIGGLAGAIIGIISHFEHDVPSVQIMLERLMHFIDQSRGHLPSWVLSYLPDDTNDIKEAALNWIQTHLAQLQQGGKDAARGAVRVVIGMILGAMIAVGARHHAHRRPLAAALVARVARLADAFRRIVFAQIKISAINASFTGIYLLVALPIFHTRLPLSKTMVLVAFIVGLLPVVGNLISNTLIVIVALSVSLPTALASLVFLVVIHKLEYFLNARIVSGEIEAKAWELLIAMLAMEAAFGIAGLVAAPIYYAYLKRELILQRLV